jgi:hypothetical protein
MERIDVVARMSDNVVDMVTKNISSLPELLQNWFLLPTLTQPLTLMPFYRLW